MRMGDICIHFACVNEIQGNNGVSIKSEVNLFQFIRTSVIIKFKVEWNNNKSYIYIYINSKRISKCLYKNRCMHCINFNLVHTRRNQSLTISFFALNFSLFIVFRLLFFLRIIIQIGKLISLFLIMITMTMSSSLFLKIWWEFNVRV